MVRKRDRFWEFAVDLKNSEELKDRFKCNFCQKEFCGGISRVKSHLSGVKGRDIEICPKVPENIRNAAFEAISSLCKKGKNIEVSVNGDEGGINSNQRTWENDVDFQAIRSPCKKGKSSIAVSVNGDEGGTNSSLTTCKNDKTAIDKNFVKLYLLNNISEDVFQSRAFFDFVKGVGEFGPGYELPNLSLRDKLVSVYEREILGYIRNVKESWVKTGCTLTFDVEQCYGITSLNVFAYCPRGVVFLNSSRSPSYSVPDNLRLEDIVLSTLDEIGPNNVVQLVVDHFDRHGIAKGILLATYPQLYICNCAIREIQLLLKDIYNDVGWVRRITKVGKMIMSYIHRRGIKLSLQIQKHTKYKTLEHPCLASFSSNFLLLHSILEFKSELRALQLLNAPSDRERLDFNMLERGKWVANVIESTIFWTLGEEMMHIVDIIFRVFRLVSGDAFTSGYLYEAMKRAGNAIRQCYEKDQAKYNTIWKTFDYRKRMLIIHPIHAAAAFLNPTNMCDENFEEDLEMQGAISFMVDNVVATSESRQFLAEVEHYRMKIPEVFTTTALQMLTTSHPLTWWDYCGDRLPVLRKYAVRILSQPCSSSCNIKKFKAMANYDNMRMNLLMMEKFSEPKAHYSEPIDLDKITGLPEYVNHQDLEDLPDLESIYEEIDNFYDPLRLWLANEDDFEFWYKI